MTREKVFICNSCGNEYSRWMGKCDACGEWNSLKEVSKADIEIVKEVEKTTDLKYGELKKLSDGKFEGGKYVSGIGEWDRVLGGGLVKGSMCLIGGEPGIGKSTLLMQVAGKFVEQGIGVLYISGEESINQVAGRADRLGLETEEIDFLDSIYIEQIESILKDNKYQVVVVDSIQTLASLKLSGGIGSIAQVKYCVARLMQIAKSLDISIILIGHVTKEGEVAGPKVLEHLVDAVVFFEGERSESLRVLRLLKNRYGAVDETGVFVMGESGLNSVSNISKLFLKERKKGVPGSVLSVTLEGTRPFLVEIQSIADRTSFGNPKRTSIGVDSARLSMLLAVLGKRAGVNIYDQDIYLNVVGGFKLVDRSTDLGVVAAVASVVLDRPVASDIVIVGEVGLLGEIRRVKAIDKRINEALLMGVNKVYGPKVETKNQNYIGVSSVEELLKMLFE